MSVVAGRYRLEREVGRGGMGAVWLARDEVLGRAVAVKRLGLAPPSGAAAGATGVDLARAEREARLAAMLNHPHVVAVFDLVVEDDQQWLVMEHVPSLTLAGLVHRDGPLGPARSAALLAQVADALAVAHEAGIVHRDVKPSNLLVTDDDHVKITDFGIARAQADASLTATGLVTGSPAYLAPEAASGRAATPASDVWSLGATLFHALAGHPPYDVGDNVVGALYRIVHEDPPRLDPARAGWLAPVLEATMATDPAQRWSAARVREVLLGGPAALAGRAAAEAPATAVLARPPVPAASPGTTTAAAPTATAEQPPGAAAASRRPVLLVLAALVVVLLGAGLVALLDGGGEGTPAASPSSGPAGGGDGSPTPEPSGSPEPPPPTAEEMEEFVEDYLDTVTEDPASTWERLTPAFQDASGGFGDYEGFWSTVRDARLREVTADPATLTVDYTVEYRTERGGRTTDQVRLTLAQVDGELLIADEG
ncbi:protein kinase domain-containing protein [Nocardioides perillae]|uniref:non-specific serine/threonine protein kinase n=1 Tax=Nocardioides perillae TaxID=1119534 RepID=A0A7Y9UKN6_9ACTN|nr:hypothetical protein [Nocardioides perillae]